MNQIITTGIILARIDFQEADRILTVLTPDQGKVRAIAKGVRRPASKLAGGIELFSVSDLTFLPSRGELKTLISSRLLTHYANIVQDIERTMFGYELLKRINRVTEDAAGEEYFDLLRSALAGLNNATISLQLVELWFLMQLLKITGHTPNLQTDTEDQKLSEERNYILDFEAMTFVVHENGPHTAKHIKLLRLAVASTTPLVLSKVQDADKLIPVCLQLAKTMAAERLRL